MIDRHIVPAAFALFVSFSGIAEAEPPWHTKTLSFMGPATSESETTNPFTDYRLLVTFKHSEISYTIRGFYAADGNAAQTSADSGPVWLVRFSPDRAGLWTYSATLRTGRDIAVGDDSHAGTPVTISNATGSFVVAGAQPTPSPDFRHRGKLIADGHYLRFANSGPYWLKGGADSPENLLAYADFDGTYRIATEAKDGEATPTMELHRYQPHVRDWQERDPVWQSEKGKGLIGAINYLSSTGMNAVYFLTMNIGGDGKDVWPYASPDDFTRFDCSKLDQWEIVFEHMQRRGILLHVVTQETENERLLDDGDTGRLRRLYYRELIARFAHHPALVWNLGEENGPADFSPNGQTATQQKAMATFLKANDPYRHPVVIHTHANAQGKDEILPELLGHAPLDGLSLQVGKPERVHDEIVRWRAKSTEAGRRWLIGMDEIGPWHTGAVPDSDDADHELLRRHVLWGSLLAGAAGVEWYFGAKYAHNDLTSEDWRQRANLWRQTRYALEFFERHAAFWKMKPSGALLGGASEAYCFAEDGSAYVVYVPAVAGRDTSRLTIDLSACRHELSIYWFDPRRGGQLQRGSIQSTKPTRQARLGSPPSDSPQDWVVLIR